MDRVLYSGIVREKTTRKISSTHRIQIHFSDILATTEDALNRHFHAQAAQVL